MLSIKMILHKIVKLCFSLFLDIVIPLTRRLSKNKKLIFIMSTPRHCNLGDHAIVYSQHELFKNMGLKNSVIEIVRPLYEMHKEKLQNLLKPDDIIIIDGGGNIGTLWAYEENMMRDIVSGFHNNPIFIMPQTAHFEDSDSGKKELEESIKVYCNHPDLTIFCRDEVTYGLINQKFKGVKTFYVPDMVMYLTDIEKRATRNGALICFREDLEGVCNDKIKTEVTEYIKEKNIEILYSSTLVDGFVYPHQRKKALFKKWEEFSSAEFVITDRLHGMIFCAITATPCLAIDNVSHKVRDGYKWIEHLPYIVYFDADDKIISKIDSLIEMSKKTYTYDNEKIMEKYKIIKQEIKNKI